MSCKKYSSFETNKSIEQVMAGITHFFENYFVETQHLKYFDHFVELILVLRG